MDAAGCGSASEQPVQPNNSTLMAGVCRKMLRALVNRGADINIKSLDGTTSMMLARAACCSGGDALAEELIALGALE